MSFSKLFEPIDHIQITIWRVLFGLVILFESFGSILVGWTKHVFIDPPFFTFNFIGFDWLQPLPGNGMYVYFALMGILALFITIGWHYRASMVLFTIGWAGLYFMHKTNYNNHHYLMLLLCIMMCFTPAHANLSVDARLGKTKRQSMLPALFKWQFIVLLLIVYTYASAAKWYPDWTSGKVTHLMFSSRADVPVLGKFYDWEWASILIAWGGILYDLLIIPMLLYKPTRRIALVLSIVFHLFNSLTFQIGTFPYMMIGAMVLFFPPATIRKLFRLPMQDDTAPFENIPPARQRWIVRIFSAFFIIQILLPLRHHLIKGSVYWTEEGHKLSWRMMLRSKSGNIHFRIYDKNEKLIFHNALDHLSRDQYHTMAAHPDMIWQYCQYLKKLYGNEISIKVQCWVSLNGRLRQQLIDPEYDMARAQWHTFKHEEWILPFDWNQ